MKYRGNFEIDACERQFERSSGRAARKLSETKFDKWEKDTLKSALGGAKRRAERVRGKRPWQGEERDRD